MARRRSVLLGTVTILTAGLAVVPGSALAAKPRCFGEVATIVGKASSEQIVGTSGKDVIVGKGGDDEIYGRGGKDKICGGAGGDFIDGGGKADKIKGGGGSDIILGGGGGDTLEGNKGFDSFQGNKGDDSINGGDNAAPPFDLVSYADAGGPVSVDLMNGTASGVGVGTDVLRNVEDVEGSDFADTLIGNNADYGDALFGLAGNDTIDGNGGPDIVDGGPGDDTMDGGEDAGDSFDSLEFQGEPLGVDVNLATGVATGHGNDTIANFEGVIGTGGDDVLTAGPTGSSLNGLHGNDTYTGGDGNDFFTNGPDDDTIVGGGGFDTLDHFDWAVFWSDFFGEAPAPVTVDLEAGTSTGQGNDTVSGVEEIGGTHLNDTLLGSPGSDSMYGFDGNDTLEGRAGDDTLDADCSLIFGGCFVTGNGTSDSIDGGDGTDGCVGGETEVNCEGAPAVSAMRRTSRTWGALRAGSLDQVLRARLQHAFVR